MTTYTITEAQRQQLLTSYDTSQSLSHDVLDHLTRVDGCWDLLKSLTPNSGEEVAYMTSDGRVAMRYTVDTAMHQTMRDSYRIPLFTRPMPAQDGDAPALSVIKRLLKVHEDRGDADAESLAKAMLEDAKGAK